MASLEKQPKENQNVIKVYLRLIEKQGQVFLHRLYIDYYTKYHHTSHLSSLVIYIGYWQKPLAVDGTHTTRYS